LSPLSEDRKYPYIRGDLGEGGGRYLRGGGIWGMGQTLFGSHQSRTSFFPVEWYGKKKIKNNSSNSCINEKVLYLCTQY
jgi:hypothetical protein